MLKGIELWDMLHILLQYPFLFTNKCKSQEFSADPVTWHLRSSWLCFLEESFILSYLGCVWGCCGGLGSSGEEAIGYS